jgi:putative DNA primase/helicase
MNKLTDFNDMAKLSGLEAVNRAIGVAKPVEQKTDPAGSSPVDSNNGGKGDVPPGKKNTTGGDPNGENDKFEPEPLRATLPPAEPYPVEALGDVLGKAASAIHESVKAPLALCCQSVLAAASLAVQAHFDIKLPWGERKPLSLFLLTVGESGERKSGVDDLVLGAAKVQERADMAAYALKLKTYESKLAAWTQATDAARKVVTSSKKGAATALEVREAADKCGEKPEPPIVPLCFMTDPTVEGMYKQLAIGKPSVALFSDEGGLLIGGHALNSDNALKTMARWCKMWDGSPFDRVRAGDGAGILYGRRMAFHQLAQPDVMTTLLSDRMANGQGLLARCLVAWPESTIGTRHIEKYEWPGDRHELKRLFAVFKGLMEAEPPTGKSVQELNPVELPLIDEAKALAMAANNQFETLMARGADLAELRDRTSKAVENACRIAGVLAVIEGGLTVRAIDTGHLERALILVQWYLSEALRIRGAAAIPQSVSDAELLSLWLHERGFKQFRSKQVLNSGPNQLRNKTRLTAATSELVTNGYLAENEKGTIVNDVAARKSWRVLHHVV